MTDLEMTRLCAEAMGIKPNESLVRSVNYDYALAHCGYDPLHDDAQAMALVKMFRLSVDHDYVKDRWETEFKDGDIWTLNADSDLNRAIVECVAKMQEGKGK